MRSKLLKFSAYQAVISFFVFVISYFSFHYISDIGITPTWQPEPGKPFVTNMIGILGTLFFFSSAICLLAAFVFFDKKEK